MSALAQHSNIRRQGMGTHSAPKPRIIGKVESFHMTLGFGNILGDDGVNYFVHQSDITSKLTDVGFRGLKSGQTVDFKPGINQKTSKPQAFAVSVSESSPIELLPADEVGVWEPQKGILDIKLDGRNGSVATNISPCVRFGTSDIYHTSGTPTGLKFTLPEGQRVVAVGLDAKKNIVSDDAVPLAGTVLVVRRVSGGMVNATAYRFGYRYDVEFGARADIIIVETRLEIFSFPEDSTASELEKLIEVTFGGQTLQRYNLEFVPAILAATKRFK